VRAMIVAEYLPPRSHVLWALARQMGIRHTIVNAKPQRTGLNPPWDIDALRQVQREFTEAGLALHGLEGDQFDMSRIKLGLEGRDEDIERYCRLLRNMGELGIPLLCYNFMAQIGWFRSNVGAVVDGGTRDSGMVIAMGYPLFARYRSPVEAFGRVITIDHQVPIRMSGELTETVIVNPGDFIFGDLDGVLVVPKDLTLPVLEEAERIAGIEDAARVDFKRGDDPLDVYKRHKRF
jgi:hypothetical protein